MSRNTCCYFVAWHARRHRCSPNRFHCFPKRFFKKVRQTAGDVETFDTVACTLMPYNYGGACCAVPFVYAKYLLRDDRRNLNLRESSSSGLPSSARSAAQQKNPRNIAPPYFQGPVAPYYAGHHFTIGIIWYKQGGRL